MTSVPRTHYAKSGDVNIAYQVYGSGPRDLIFVPGFVSQIEHYWEEPNFAGWLTRLGQFARVVLFDKRGTGLSDRVAIPPMDERMDDIRAVMDAVGSNSAAVLGFSEGGSLATIFAAYHPDRCDNLILAGAFANFNSWFPNESGMQKLLAYVDTSWGTGANAGQFVPSLAHDQRFVDWWGKYERLSATPRDVRRIMEMNSRIDITDILPTIKTPTLVLHRTDDVLVSIEGGRTLARLIPGARLVEIPGKDHFVFTDPAGSEQSLAAIEEFLTGNRREPVIDRVLAAVVFTDIVNSTVTAQRLGDSEWRRLLDAHDRVVRAEVARFRGTEVKSLGDGFLLTFDGPGRALRCARAISDAVAALGIHVRVGVHTGEVEITRDDVRGIAVHIAARIAAIGGGDEIMVSRTVKDLVAGSGFGFLDCGMRQLKGLPEEWQVFRAVVKAEVIA